MFPPATVTDDRRIGEAIPQPSLLGAGAVAASRPAPLATS